MMGGGAEWHGIDARRQDAAAVRLGDAGQGERVRGAAGRREGAGRRAARATHARGDRRRARRRQEDVAEGDGAGATAAADVRRHHGGERQEEAGSGRRRRTDGDRRRGRGARRRRQRARRAWPRSGSRPTRSTRCACSSIRRRCRPTSSKWIDVDLGEQVLVTYENDKPTFATLISSGRAIATPMGTYPGVGQGLGDHHEEPALRGQGVLREQGAVVDVLPVAQRDPRRVLARSLRRLEVARLRERVAARRPPRLRVGRRRRCRPAGPACARSTS